MVYLDRKTEMLKHLPLKRLAETLAARDEGHERRAPVKGISEGTAGLEFNPQSTCHSSSSSFRLFKTDATTPTSFRLHCHDVFPFESKAG